jgi:hypothetical protein
VKFLAAVLLGLVLAAPVLAREVGFGEYRAAQESLRYLPPNIRFYEMDRLGFLPRSPAPALSDSVGLRLIGKWGAGPSVKVTGRDSLVFLSRGSEVVAINYADTNNPRILSYIQVNGLVSRSVLVGNRLYVGSTGSDPKYIDVYDVSSPANPQKLGFLQTRLLDIDVVDTLVYTVAKDSFRVFNFADPANPRQLGACRDTGYALSVCNGYAYIADRWGLFVVDARDPTSPHHEASWGSDVIGVKSRGNICCATLGNPNQPTYLKFYVLDARNPSSITPLGSLDSCGGYDIYLDDSLAFLSGYYTGGHEFRILSISDSTHPRAIGSCVTPGDNNGVWAAVARNRAYVADRYRGLTDLDISSLQTPGIDTSRLAAGLSVDVAVDQGTAYVANSSYGMPIVDVSDPAHPRQLGAVDSTCPLETRSVAARDSFAYMGWSPAFLDLRTMNVSDPSHPVSAGGDSVFSWPEDMVLRDSILYAAESRRLEVFNVARPREPVLVGSCVTQDGVYFGLVVQDTLAYTVGDGFQIVNIARPSSPFLVSTTAGGASGLAVRDTFAYVPNGWDTVHVYSVANPAAPCVVSAVPCGVWPWDAALGESKLYVGASDGWGVDVYDLTNPGLPVRRGRASAPTDVRRLQYANGRLYAAMWEAGVAIYETTATGIHEQDGAAEKLGALRVWPNVTGDNVRFTVGQGARSLEAAIYDVSGKRRGDVSIRIYRRGGATEGEVGLSALPAGLYIIRVESEGKNLTAKVVRTNRR